MRNQLKVTVTVFAALTILSCQLGIREEDRVLTIVYWQAPSVPSAYHFGGIKDIDAPAITLEPLARNDPSGNVVPVLASSVPVVGNGVSADLTSITWTLKKGLKWSDGSDLTTDDVEFTWRQCTNPNSDCTGESSFDGITNIEAIDSETVRITFEAPIP